MPIHRPRLLASLLPRLAAIAIISAAASAAADPRAPSDLDRSLSPYFVVDGATAGTAMPLISSEAEVNIAGVIADVVVRQVYANQGAAPIHARYVFPASTRAAVYGMTMTVGSRIVRARIKEREAARAEYDRAKQSGKTASLLEQDRPNVFSMRVANVLPGDRIAVELRYTELLVATDGIYQWIYPTVVGPRYATAATATQTGRAAVANQFVRSGYLAAGTPPSYRFGLRATVAAGMPIQSIESPSHGIVTKFDPDRSRAAITLDPSDADGGDRDFVLRYRLAGKDLASGLLLFRGERENFFLLMVQPPARPSIDAIPPRDYVFVLDVSGSMVGFPLDTAKAVMRGLLGRLRPTDTFDVVLFAGTSNTFADSPVPATVDNINRALAFVDQPEGSGGTELVAALDRALALPRPAAAVARSVVVVTDGYIAEEPTLFGLVRDNLDAASVFAFGIGSSVNRHLIEGLARAGQGEPFVVLDPSEADAAADRLIHYIESPVLTSPSLSFAGFDAYDIEPATIADVFAQRPVVVFGKWRGPLRGSATLTGVSGRGRSVDTIQLAGRTPDPNNAALAQLWARAKIARLSDDSRDDEKAKPTILELGLGYNLLTRYTSFIAVEDVVRTTAAGHDVDQALPLPSGVDDAAVGIAEGPEPALGVLLAAVAATLGLALAARRLGLPVLR